MFKRMDSGFTILELTMALGVASGLLVIALAGQSQIRARTRFSDSVERANTLVLSVKNQAFTTVSVNNPGTYQNTFLGKAIQFTAGSSTVNIYSLATNSAGAIVTPLVPESSAVLPYSVIDQDGQNKCMIFTKNPETAQTAAFTLNNCDPTSNLSNPSTYDPAGAAAVLLGDGGSLTATLSFNPKSLSVSKVFH